MPHFDFIVSGAGPGGSFAARELADMGFEVLLLEKDRFPRYKPCAGWTTPEVWEMLGWSEQRVHSYPIEGAVFYGPDLRSFRSDRNIGNRGVIREEFDHAMALDAVEHGAVLRDGERVKSVSPADPGIRVITTKAEYTSEAVIGADGTNSVVARTTGLRMRWDKKDLLISFVRQILLTERERERLNMDLPDHSHIFITDYSIGYGWFSVKGPYLNMGIGEPFQFLRDGKALWSRFLRDVARIFNISHIDLSKPQGYAYPAVHGPTFPTFGERVLLIGDAGGFASNLTGEGIGPAMVTGRMAAEVLSLAHEAEDFSSSTLARYEKMWKAEFQRDFDAVNRVLSLYEGHPRLRHWVNHHMVDFLEVLHSEPGLEENLLRAISSKGSKEEAFHAIWHDVPEILARFILRTVRKRVGVK